VANPIAVKGIKKIIDKVGDEVMEAAKKAKRLDMENTTFEANGRMTLSGKYGIDKNGEFGFVGNVMVETAEGAPVIASVGEGELATDLLSGVDWNSHGDGNLEVEFSVRLTVNKPLSILD
jgi:hypothetical protein